MSISCEKQIVVTFTPCEQPFSLRNSSAFWKFYQDTGNLLGSLYSGLTALTLSMLNMTRNIGGSKGGARDARPPLGPNSFIFMQFSGTKLKNNSTFGSWHTPLDKILDPPLRKAQYRDVYRTIEILQRDKIWLGLSPRAVQMDAGILSIYVCLCFS